MFGSGQTPNGVMDSHRLSKADLFFARKISAADIEHQPDKLRKQIFQQTISDLERLRTEGITSAKGMNFLFSLFQKTTGLPAQGKRYCLCDPTLGLVSVRQTYSYPYSKTWKS